MIGLHGEREGAGHGNVTLGWGICPAGATGPLTWRKASFSVHSDVIKNESLSVMLDASGMSRGHFYLNGVDLGKFWTIRDGRSGQLTQRYYQLPRSLLLPSPAMNLLVLADELGAKAPSQARIVFSTMEPTFEKTRIAAARAPEDFECVGEGAAGGKGGTNPHLRCRGGNACGCDMEGAEVWACTFQTFYNTTPPFPCKTCGQGCNPVDPKTVCGPPQCKTGQLCCFDCEKLERFNGTAFLEHCPRRHDGNWTTGQCFCVCSDQLPGGQC